MNVSEDCVLCSSGRETHHHLFFECPYSATVWGQLAARIWPNPPSDIHSAAAWISLNRHRQNSQAQTVSKLLLQSAVYLIWRERNARIFTGKATPATTLRVSIDRLMRDRLLSFPSQSVFRSSLLEFYFFCFRPP
ncbi:unnamed protein product [Microthlaspi erraticum]|uniref:Reverse transcriptase zinc-binding domain-containing protein n=1 Tax=Microthlaspi erraticum TaxID=1685480 RepID=A0A6D2KCX6_9BRAS|nr:unnamed protein product [Microthlaspi erraticum]CAA7045966.1 unnamed protein product [Microthlaspi erraticum]